MKLRLTYVMLFVLFLALGPSASADAIDQSFFSPNFNFQGFGLVAQTYTAGITGTLTSINLQFLVCSICGGGNVPISINTVSGGVPTSTVLGSTVLPVSTGQLIPFSSSITFPTAIPQVAGVQYAIVINFGVLGGTNVTGEFNNTGYGAGGLFSSFDGGQTWSSNAGSDISFQTKVNAVAFGFTGFLHPVDNLPVVNVAKAGRSIPVKWQLRDAQGQYISSLSSFTSLTSGPIACDAAPTSVVEEEAVNTGGTALRYDSDTNEFIYNWKTMNDWTGCRLLVLSLADGTLHFAEFDFR